MENRINSLIKKGIENPAAFEAALLQMESESRENPEVKEALFFDFKNSLAAKKHEIDDLKMKAQLAEVAEIISLSYIAKKYFKKTRAWLHQRINSNLVNGKPAGFSAEEIDTLNFALKDISKKIGSVSVR